MLSASTLTPHHRMEPSPHYLPESDTMKKIAASLLLSAVLSAATILPASAASTWDCDTTGVAQCKGSVRTIGDAWESFDAASPAVKYSQRNALRYTKTVHTKPTTTKNTLVLKSPNLKNTYHVFTRFAVPLTPTKTS